MHPKCNFKCLQACRTRPTRCRLYFMDYGFVSVVGEKYSSNPDPNTELGNWPLTLTEEGIIGGEAKLRLCGCCFKILFFFMF